MASFNFNGSIIKRQGDFSVVFDVSVKMGVVVRASNVDEAEELALYALEQGDYELLEIGDILDTEIEEA